MPEEGMTERLERLANGALENLAEIAGSPSVEPQVRANAAAAILAFVTPVAR